MARRDNEVFVVVDNQIRWSSLAKLKDDWKQQSRVKGSVMGTTASRQDTPGKAPYKVGNQLHDYSARLAADPIRS